MVSKQQIKFINNLHTKKYRKQYSMFIAEGNKLISNLINNNLNIELLVATDEWIENNNIKKDIPIIECDHKDLKKISALKTPTDVVAVFHFPIKKEYEIKKSLSLLLDDVQDPGNLGTIIRLADWFGIKNIFCSIGTVDAYNSKVIQATMGAIAGINIEYCDLSTLINKYSSTDFPVYGTFMEGENLYSSKLSNKGFIVMGNEGNGISNKLKKLITNKLNIPSYKPNEVISESLNVATATAIVFSEFRKNI